MTHLLNESEPLETTLDWLIPAEPQETIHNYQDGDEPEWREDY